MPDASLQTTNYKFQKIADGSLSATAGQTAVAGNLTKGSQELEPGDYNSMLTTIDTNLPLNPNSLAPANTIAAAGTNAATGTPITARITVVTGADGTKGVTLPTASVGSSVRIVNNSASALKVWPKVGTDTINSIAAGTNILMAANTSAEFICAVAGAWFTVPTVPS
jgi:hypothetical protein